MMTIWIFSHSLQINYTDIMAVIPSKSEFALKEGADTFTPEDLVPPLVSFDLLIAHNTRE